MKLSEISIRNPVFAWMLMLSLMVFGMISFLRLGISQMPDVDFPVVNISYRLDGAAPTVMENDVIDPVEDALAGLEGIRQIQSTARYATADITVELGLNRDVDIAVLEISAVLSQAQRVLPRDLEPPVVRKSNPEDSPVLWLVVTSTGPLPQLMSYVRYQLRDRFAALPGVGDIILGGYVDRTIEVNASLAALNSLELSVTDVSATIASESLELPAGRQDGTRSELPLRTMGEVRSAAEVAALPLMSRAGTPVFRTIRLGEIAEVIDGLADIRRISRFNGIRSIGLGIRKQRGSNAVEVGNKVKELAEELRPSLPQGYEIRLTYDSTVFVEEAIDELKFTLLLAVLLTGFVLYLFLGTPSATINVLLAIPTSILGTFIFIDFMGFTLNTFTMLALSLAIGIVVDDAIMVLENITRHREMGKDARTAALDGAAQITFAAIAATFSIVAIFLPVAYMQGVIGRYFYQFGTTLSVAVILSMVEALTLTAMRASLQSKSGTATGENAPLSGVLRKLTNQYRISLQWSLRNRRLVLIASAAAFTLSLLVLTDLPREFVPAQDQGRLILRVRTPAGSSLAYTDTLTSQLEAALLKRPDVAKVFVAVGGFQGGVSSTANGFITFKPPSERKPLAEIIPELRKSLNRIHPDMRVSIQDPSLQGFSATRGFPVEVSISGPEWNVLEPMAEDIRNRMTATGKLTDVDTNLIPGQKELHIEPDRVRAGLRGVSVSEISEAVSTLYGGKVAGRIAIDGHRHDIRVRLRESDRNNPASLALVRVRNNRGELVRLADVVKTEIRPVLQQINRLNRTRTVQIFANPATGTTVQEAMTAAMEAARSALRPGYTIDRQGSSRTEAESFSGLTNALVLGLLVAYMILASQFNSYRDPLIILLALPFSFSGAMLALWLTGHSLNIYSFIGLILLMGLVKKNSILIVEFANELRHSGKTTRDAIIEAAPIRLRPIAITSITTIASALPAALALGPGAETRIPMAVAVIGGMAMSTLLTLYVVPVVYTTCRKENHDITMSGSVASRKVRSRKPGRSR